MTLGFRSRHTELLNRFEEMYHIALLRVLAVDLARDGVAPERSGDISDGVD